MQKYKLLFIKQTSTITFSACVDILNNVFKLQKQKVSQKL